MRFIKTLAIFLVSILSFTACKHQDNKITIKGDIKGLNAKRVYLYSCFSRNFNPIDSADVVNDKFEFTFNPDTTFQPYLGAIGYTTIDKKKEALGIINPYTSTKNKDNLFVSMYVEPGIIYLTGDLNKKKGITLKGGPQNDFYFKNISLTFDGFSNDNAKRAKQIEYLKQLVKDNPHAYWAMVSLGNLKFSLNKQELSDIYSGFDNDVKTAYYGRQVKQFINYMPSSNNELRTNILLPDTNNKQAFMIDTTKKLNMLIFWASWCGPCNEEIPGLKKIAAEFNDKNFRMVSISIDVDKDKWRKKLAIRNMPWQQLVIPKDNQGQMTAAYNLSSIPQIYFVDGNRKLLKHIDGYDPKNEDILRATIKSALK